MNLTGVCVCVLCTVGTGDAAKQSNTNKAHALYAILFEAIQLTLAYDTDRKLLTTCVTVLGNLLSAKVRQHACLFPLLCEYTVRQAPCARSVCVCELVCVCERESVCG